MENDIKNLKLPHRDDFDHDFVKMIEEQFAKTHPGMKVVFAGDLPGTSAIPEEMQKKMDEVLEKWREDFVLGRCTDCGVKMEDWEKRMKDETMDPLAEGWAVLESTNDDELPPRLLCPACDKLDDEGDGPRLEPLNG